MTLGLAKALDRHLGACLARVVGAVDSLAETIHPPEPVAHVRRLLVVKLWGVGNWALLRPVVRDLRARFPAAALTIATLVGNRALVADLADELVLLRSDGLVRAGVDLARAALRLRRTPVDLALDFEPFAHTGGLLARLGGARQRLGFATLGGARNGLYTVTVPLRADGHAARSFRDLAEAAGVAPGPYLPGGLPTSAAGRAEAGALTGTGAYVLIHPGSGDNFPGRRWSEAGFAAAARAALAEGVRVFVTGGPAEAALAGRVARAAGPGALNLAGALSLAGLVALVAGARLVLSNDTGPVHLASALGVPTLALFGPNTPALYGPLAPGSRSFYRALPCSPCLTAASHRSSRCRIFTCMESIPVGEVVVALRRALAAGPPDDRPPGDRPPGDRAPGDRAPGVATGVATGRAADPESTAEAGV